ncbi:hypothetical protein Tco_0479279 [Tanacetum coccineum]
MGLPYNDQVAEIDPTKNNEALGMNLDLIEERREQASIQEAKKQEKDGKILQLKSPWHNGTSFKPRHGLNRAANEASHAMDDGNLGPQVGRTKYKLKSPLEKELTNSKDTPKDNEMRDMEHLVFSKVYIHEV